MKKLLSVPTVVAAIAVLAASTAWAQATQPGVSATPSAPVTSSPASSNAPSDYVVGPNDVLKITVFDEPTMSGTYRVDADGSFQYPMLGRVAAAGQRVRQIEQMLKTTLEDGYIKRAQIAVDVDQFRSRSIF